MDTDMSPIKTPAIPTRVSKAIPIVAPPPESPATKKPTSSSSSPPPPQQQQSTTNGSSITTSNNNTTTTTTSNNNDDTADIEALLASLEGKPVHEKKQQLGDRLFPLVKVMHNYSSFYHLQY